MPLYKIEDVTELADCESDPNVVDIPYDELLGHTDKAVLVKIGGEDMFIPKTQICDVDEKRKQISLSEWMAKQKGIF